MAQQVVTSKHRPPNPAECTWWLDPETWLLRHFEGGKWIRTDEWLLPKQAKKGNLHKVGELVVVDCPGWHVMVLDRHGDYAYPETGDSVNMYDSLVVLHRSDVAVLVNARHGIANARRQLNYFSELLPKPKPQFIGGKVAFCVAEYVPALPYMHLMDDPHNWGMVSEQAEWIIPPIYDGPFEFINGVAEVTKYGKRIRINEKGETVE